MAQTFYPNPLIEIVKSTLITIIISGVLMYLGRYIEDYSVYLLTIVWGANIFYCLILYILCRCQSLTLENKNLVFRDGVIAKKEYMLPFDKITEVSFKQGIIGRVLGVGHLKIDTPGGVEMAVDLKGIPQKDYIIIRGVIDKKNS